MTSTRWAPVQHQLFRGTPPLQLASLALVPFSKVCTPKPSWLLAPMCFFSNGINKMILWMRLTYTVCNNTPVDVVMDN